MILEVASFLHQVLPDSVYHIVDWPMSSGPNGGYNFWSGIAGQSVIAYMVVSWRHVNCSAPWCFRIGKNASADGVHHFCRKHHPDLPNRRLTLSELHARHHTADDQPHA